MINTLTCPIPNSINPLSPNGFKFSIQKLPELTYFCQQVNLPGIIIGVSEQNTPFSVSPVPGEMLAYDNLLIQFMVDEDMANFKGIHNWMVSLGFPENYQQYTDGLASNTSFSNSSELSKNYSSGFLQILGSNNTATQTIEFVDIFPTSLESLTFQSTNSDVNYIIGSATFRISYYKFLD